MLYPCAQCGKLALANKACPHCGHLSVDQGAAIVNWIAALPEDQRETAVRVESEQHWPPTIVRSYPGTSQVEAAGRFNWEASLLGIAGYRPVSQSWSAGGATIGDFAAFGVFSALKSDTGYLTVTYARATVELTRPTKRCPDCAEEVLVDARVCRFCRHEFVEPPQV